MTLAREDRRFITGLAAAAAVLGLYYLAVRGPFLAAIARNDREARKLEPKAALYFRNPKATPFSRVHRELTERGQALSQRLTELVDAVEFDPGPLEPTDAAAGGPADPRDLYFKLSSELHDRVKAAAEKSPQRVRVPSVFDPQGRIQTPRDPALVPRLHCQLVMAYRILLAAIEHRIAVVELRAKPPGITAAGTQTYLDDLAVAVTAEAGVAAFAAFLHTLSQPPGVGARSKFLSIAGLEIASADEDHERAVYHVTFASVRTNPKVNLAEGPARQADEPTRRRRPPRRAPHY